jgi:hypothetical protein
LPQNSPGQCHDRALTQKYVVTHRILAVLLDDIEMLRDRFMGKQGEVPKGGDRVRSVVGTGAWNRLKETAAESRRRWTSGDGS